MHCAYHGLGGCTVAMFLAAAILPIPFVLRRSGYALGVASACTISVTTTTFEREVAKYQPLRRRGRWNSFINHSDRHRGTHARPKRRMRWPPEIVSAVTRSGMPRWIGTGTASWPAQRPAFCCF
jgi:hypothetical protein